MTRSDLNSPPANGCLSLSHGVFEGEGAGVLTLGGATLALGLGVIAGVDLNEAENFLAVMTPDPFLMCCFMY